MIREVHNYEATTVDGLVTCSCGSVRFLSALRPGMSAKGFKIYCYTYKDNISISGEKFRIKDLYELYSKHDNCRHAKEVPATW